MSGVCSVCLMNHVEQRVSPEPQGQVGFGPPWTEWSANTLNKNLFSLPGCFWEAHWIYNFWTFEEWKHTCVHFALRFPGFENYFYFSLHKYSQQNFTLEISQLLFVYVWELGAELAAESTAKLILVPSEKNWQYHKQWTELLQNYIVGFLGFFFLACKCK